MADIPYTTYDRDVIERISWRVYHALQMHPLFSAQLSSGVTLAESTPLVTALVGLQDTLTAHGQQLVAIRADLAAIKQKLGI